MPRFQDYTKADAVKAASLPASSAEESSKASSFYSGDHWQNGTGWVGPAPKEATADSLRILSEIASRFCHRNLVRSVVDRHASGVVGGEPAWMFVPIRTLEPGDEPNEQEKQQAARAETIVSEWWDRTQALKEIKRAVVDSLVLGQGTLRLFVPIGLMTGFVDESGAEYLGLPLAESPEKALENLYLEASTAYTSIDQDTMRRASFMVKSSGTGNVVEMSFVDPETSETVIRTWTPDSDEPQETRLTLGGMLVAHSIEREPLVTSGMMSAQRSFNMSITMLDRNAVQGGFLERIVLNAEPPGKWEEDGKGGKTFVPTGLKIGAGMTTFLSNRVVQPESGEGDPLVFPANVLWRDPVPPDTFVRTSEVHREGVYEEAKQLHVLMGSDATASGVSRVQAKADYLSSLNDTKPGVDSLVRWLIWCVLHHACHFSGLDAAKEFSLIRPACDCQVDAGPLAADERDAVIKMVDAEMMSQETAMQLLGVEDVDAEKARISAESSMPTLGRKSKLAEVAAKVGFSLAPDQMPEMDEMLGFPPRDKAAWDEENEMRADAAREALRSAATARDPNDEDPEAQSATDDAEA